MAEFAVYRRRGLEQLRLVQLQKVLGENAIQTLSIQTGKQELKSWLRKRKKWKYLFNYEEQSLGEFSKSNFQNTFHNPFTWMWFAKLALFPFPARELVWKTRRGAVCRILSSRISRDNTSRCDKLAARNNFVKETKMREAHKLGRNTSFRSQRTKPMGNWNQSCLPLFVRNTNQNLDFYLQSHTIQ